MPIAKVVQKGNPGLEPVRIWRTSVEKALQLLHTGDYSVREVADAVGYSYSKNFTTALKRRYGVSPKIARKSFSRTPKPRTGGT